VAVAAVRVGDGVVVVVGPGRVVVVVCPGRVVVVVVVGWSCGSSCAALVPAAAMGTNTNITSAMARFTKVLFLLMQLPPLDAGARSEPADARTIVTLFGRFNYSAPMAFEGQ